MKHIDCEKAQDWMVADLDGSLDDGLRGLLEHHVAGCRVCREARMAFQDIWSSLATDTQEDLGEDFWKDYHTSLNAKLDTVSLPWWTAWYSRRFAWPATAVFVPAILALMLVVFGSGMEQPRHLPVDNASCQSLLQELNEVYGPTSEERISGAYSERVKTELLNSSKATAASSMLTWFEVEDEPNPPYL